MEIYNDYKQEYVAKLFYAFYLVFMLVTLLNFVIAILSDTYAIYSSRKNSLFLREVINLRSRQGHSPTHTWRVSGFVPFNLLLWLFHWPIHVCNRRNHIKTNNCMMMLAFSPILILILVIISTFIFLLTFIFSIVWPFLYLVMWVIIFFDSSGERCLVCCIFCCCSVIAIPVVPFIFMGWLFYIFF